MAIRERDFDDTFRGGFIEFDQDYKKRKMSSIWRQLHD